ncbi:M67 family metallopeptidase [Deinococcus sp.]|uniref:M67 family metallopeptidase n=1 Tax=Deinococcus sp. TaxID=47478 RepID=UPI002869C3BE|nr:M67 family metallopeptidase [Deinococcus sp.]
MTLHLPAALIAALWAHAHREAPGECVGVIGGTTSTDGLHATALYPLPNIAARPNSEYLADPGHLLRALKAMDADGQHLIALYHSHPTGPSWPSPTDARLAVYPVPHLIADLQAHTLQAFRLPDGEPVPIYTKSG